MTGIRIELQFCDRDGWCQSRRSPQRNAARFAQTHEGPARAGPGGVRRSRCRVRAGARPGSADLLDVCGTALLVQRVGLEAVVRATGSRRNASALLFPAHRAPIDARRQGSDCCRPLDRPCLRLGAGLTRNVRSPTLPPTTTTFAIDWGAPFSVSSKSAVACDDRESASSEPAPLSLCLLPTRP